MSSLSERLECMARVCSLWRSLRAVLPETTPVPRRSRWRRSKRAAAKSNRSGKPQGYEGNETARGTRNLYKVGVPPLVQIRTTTNLSGGARRFRCQGRRSPLGARTSCPMCRDSSRSPSIRLSGAVTTAPQSSHQWRTATPLPTPLRIVSAPFSVEETKKSPYSSNQPGRRTTRFTSTHTAALCWQLNGLLLRFSQCPVKDPHKILGQGESLPWL